MPSRYENHMFTHTAIDTADCHGMRIICSHILLLILLIVTVWESYVHTYCYWYCWLSWYENHMFTHTAINTADCPIKTNSHCSFQSFTNYSSINLHLLSPNSCTNWSLYGRKNRLRRVWVLSNTGFTAYPAFTFTTGFLICVISSEARSPQNLYIFWICIAGSVEYSSNLLKYIYNTNS